MDDCRHVRPVLVVVNHAHYVVSSEPRFTQGRSGKAQEGPSQTVLSTAGPVIVESALESRNAGVGSALPQVRMTGVVCCY